VNLRDFVPEVVLQGGNAFPWMKWQRGSVLFADVSGFTPMSEALSTLGVEGAEILTDILNRYFQEMIAIIHRYGGQVMKFGGDAILCFFPGENSLHRTLYAAQLMQEVMPKFQSIRTSVKRFTLRMKIGIAEGDVLLAGVGDPGIRCDYVFAGTPVDLTSDAEHHAEAGDIVLASQTKPAIPGLQVSRIEGAYYLIRHIPECDPMKQERIIARDKDTKTSLIQSYLISEVFELVSRGYHSHVGALLSIVPVFLQFKGFSYSKKGFHLEMFDDFFRTVMEITHRYEGRLNRISMGDKGSTFFILFGAPKALERKEELASQWALDVKKMIADRFSHVSFSVGMNSGRVFAGIVGGAHRWEYTVMGDAVNFSARIMQGAKQWQLCASQTFYEHASSNYEFRELGFRTFKGKKDPLLTYFIQGKCLENNEWSGDKKYHLVGREKVFQFLEQKSINVEKGKPSMVLLQGPAGIGKSFLIRHLMNRLSTCEWRIITTRGEITAQTRSYKPWKDLIRQIVPDGINGIQSCESYLSAINSELTESASLLSEFLEYTVSDVSTSNLDPRTRKKRLHHLISRILLDVIKEKPGLVIFENMHWWDASSMELLEDFLSHLRVHRIFIVGIARDDWDAYTIRSRPIVECVNLEALHHNAIKDLIGEILKFEPHEDLLSFVKDRTKGNPLYIENLLTYLSKEKKLEKRLDRWFLKRGEEGTVSLSGSGIILAQISQLPLEERILLQFASCIGNTFSLDILSCAKQISQNDKRIEGLKRKGILEDLGAGSLQFTHNIIQETIYSTLPKKIRSRYHFLIAKAIESINSKDLETYFPNLSNHYYLAGKQKEAREYAICAAEHMVAHYAYPEAHLYFSRAFSLLTRTRDQRKWSVGLQLGDIQLKLGKLQETVDLSIKIRHSARRKKLKEIQLRARILEYDAQKRSGDYSYQDQAVKIINKIRDIKLKNHLDYLISETYFRQGNFKVAKAHFTRLIQTDIEFVSLDDVLSAYTFLGTLLGRQRDYEAAFRIFEEGIKLATVNDNVYHKIRLLIGLTSPLKDSGNIDKAIEIQNEILTQAERIGDYYYMASIYLNLGFFYMSKCLFEQSKKYMTESISIFESLGAKNGAAKGWMNMGILSFHMKNYEASKDYYIQAVHFFEKSGELLETVPGYYNLAEVCIELNQIEEAELWFTKGIKVIKKENEPGLQNMFDELRLRLSKH